MFLERKKTVKIKNKIMLLTAGVITILMYSTTTSHAALQANGKSTKTDLMNNWLLNIRKMEATGGTLGLSDTINTTNLTSSASESNNLDIHMELNTEYGAMAILSASSYGNPNKINSGETTTGNKSGVYINLNKEWVAAAGKSVANGSVPNFANANSKYKNIYDKDSYVTKRGDALVETKGWHGSNSSEWLDGNGESGFVRAASGSVFSYNGVRGNWNGYAILTKSYNATRAVVVIGNGL